MLQSLKQMDSSIVGGQTRTIQFKSVRDLLVEGQSMEYLMCTICSELVIDPRECDQCQNLFCNQCISDWLKQRTYCPFKCPNQPMTHKEPHRFVRNTLNSIKIYCPNKDSGCNELICMDQLDSHSKKCEFEPQQCQYEKCTLSFIKKQLLEHEQECQYRVINCDKCNETILFRLKNEHDCISSMCSQIKSLKIQQEEQNQNYKSQITKQEEIIKKLMQRLQILETKFSSLNYICAKQHPLNWTQGAYGDCQQCKKTNQVIRYACGACKIGYCQGCKPPLIQLNKCPIGHQLEFQQKAASGISCDFCSVKPYHLNISNWQDRACDFDICDNCYSKIHQQ